MIIPQCKRRQRKWSSYARVWIGRLNHRLEGPRTNKTETFDRFSSLQLPTNQPTGWIVSFGSGRADDLAEPPQEASACLPFWHPGTLAVARRLRLKSVAQPDSKTKLCESQLRVKKIKIICSSLSENTRGRHQPRCLQNFTTLRFQTVRTSGA
jgi:hypothetical protein